MQGELQSERTTVRRLPARAAYDRATVHAIVDEALVCQVGFAVDGQPFVIPTIHGRSGDVLYLHGSAASRMLRSLSGGIPLCVSVTLVDGLVMARSAFHHSMNYRSVVVLGRGEEVTDPAEKLEALRVIVEHVSPGRWQQVRSPNSREMKATLVLRVGLSEASAKIRRGGPIDDEEDYAVACWAGVLPLQLTPGAPIADTRLAAGVSPPAWSR